MTHPRVGPWEIDPIRMLAVDDTRKVQLSTNDVEMLTYLAGAGEPVSRETLLHDVFGYAAGVQSRAVDMALRRLRKKLEPDPSNPVYICSRRQVGVWLEQSAPQEDQDDVASVPLFGTPYVPREDLETRALDLLDAGWRVVDLVGPAGAGKTRIALEVSRQVAREVVVCSVAGCTDADHIEQRIGQAGGIDASGTSTLARALAKRGALVVLDEADRCVEAMRTVVERLAEVPFLVTSRVVLNLPNEAVVTVSGMDGDAARAFLQARLAASRWAARPVSPEAETALIEASDGLPLALELVAAYADGPEQLLEDLRSGELEGSSWLNDSIRRSIDPLPPRALELLQHLSTFDTPLTRADVSDWLGTHGADALQELADRSLVVPRRSGWLVLRTVRAYVEGTAADWDAICSSRNRWLVRKMAALHELHKLRPREAFEQWRLLLDDMLEALGEIDLDSLPRYTLALFGVADAISPSSTVEHVLRTALTRLPDDPLINALAVQLPEYKADRRRIQLALEADDPLTQATGMQMLSEYAPREIDEGLAQSILERLDDPFAALGVKRQIALHRSLTGQGADKLLSLVAPSAQYPLEHIFVLYTLAGAHRRAHRVAQALGCLDQAIRLTRSIGMPRADRHLTRARAQTMAAIDPRAGAEALLIAADEVERAGHSGDYSRWSAGICLYAVGDIDRASEVLASVLPGADAVKQLGWLVLNAIRLRQGTGGGHALEAFAPDDFAFNNPDGSPAGEALAVWARGELDLSTGARTPDAVASACNQVLEHPVLPRIAMLLRELASRS